MAKIRIVDPNGKRYTWTEWWKQGVADDYGLAARLGAMRRGEELRWDNHFLYTFWRAVGNIDEKYK